MYAVEILENPRPEQIKKYKPRWQELLECKTDNLYRLYQSYEWFEYLLLMNNENKYLCVLTNSEQQIVGLIPLISSSYNLVATVKQYNLINFPIKALEVLGGEILADNHAFAYRALVKGLHTSLSGYHAIYFKSLPQKGVDIDAIVHENTTTDAVNLYFPHKDRMLHSIDLPPSFEGYTKKFSSKKRNFYKRRMRQLEENTPGSLEYLCIEREDQVDDFVSNVAAMLAYTWKDKCYDVFSTIPGADELKLLARKNILRAYVLKSDDTYLAFVLGYVYDGVYHYSDLGYHENYAKYSPGTVLLYHLIEDVIACENIESVNFGIHDARYKREFGNNLTKDCSLLIFKNTLYNKFAITTHSAVCCILNYIKNTARSFKDRSVVNTLSLYFPLLVVC